MTATDTLAAQLRDVFGDRLRMVAGFGHAAHTVALADSVTASDLDKCASFCPSWKKAGLPPPLVMEVDELSRALDAFPLEFSEILATRTLIAGADLLAALKVPIEDLRRAAIWCTCARDTSKHRGMQSRLRDCWTRRRRRFARS
jgi:hypothetical protein